ncbi:MAG: hypothetical protein GFH27_549371n54 [Chloroflexi bacterium AL-W]|nr:hypothetical protein [Chloroflexi bacterium AL-N1]NOK70915.1 hypothetical protein [Chloroflexi bacterium AL-N10]NOK78584.1 hypothetical protein [Chloroflexi bacterium AL-N5]NOK85816.1 hypothetical protein [Chloroflexi bacterium AL-W]NOK92732.1 hypothetical protein [Chloroflexi bacterium AL-N15]
MGLPTAQLAKLCTLRELLTSDSLTRVQATLGWLWAVRNTTSEQAMEALVQALFLCVVAACHTLVPDMVEIHQWFNNLQARLDQLYVDIQQQVQILYNLESAKLERYGIITTFYDVSDSAVLAARAIQHGEFIDIAQLQATVASGANKSRYGLTLEHIVLYLHHVTTFWRGGCDTLETPDTLQDLSVG